MFFIRFSVFDVFVSLPGKRAARQIANKLIGSSQTGCLSETGSSKREIKTAVLEMDGLPYALPDLFHPLS